jgi:hypothetical protein
MFRIQTRKLGGDMHPPLITHLDVSYTFDHLNGEHRGQFVWIGEDKNSLTFTVRATYLAHCSSEECKDLSDVPEGSYTTGGKIAFSARCGSLLPETEPQDLSGGWSSPGRRATART